MNDEGPLNDSVFDDSGPFSVTPDGAGVSLDQALREFGPAAIDDLMPRLRALAADLDEAHAAGFVHGRLHPSKVLITDDATYVMGRRVPASATLTREADQYALATMAYEWMCGRPIIGPAERPVDVRSLPGVDRTVLSQAFTRALSPDPSRRFESCWDFVDAISRSVIPSLPLMAAEDDEDPVEPLIPERVEPSVIEREPDFRVPEFRNLEPAILEREVAAVPVPSWHPTAETHGKPSDRFSGFALILAALVGMVAGFAAGYMARPRALQTAPREMATAQSAQGAQSAQRAQGAEPVLEAPAPRAPSAPSAPSAPTRIGRLLVRSTPSGASVEVDGVARGVTPLALRDLDLGAREIAVTRNGYVPEERRIVLTKARPSRSVEVRLSAAATAGRAVSPERAQPRPREGGPSPPASIVKPVVSTGVLAVESLPTGASVTVNGTPSGTTPLTLNDLPPGDYRVTISLSGYRDFATTVRVVAGERARAAARLTEQEQE